MRARIALLAAAALAAGCSVKTEGAACSIPGTTDNCPAGQACGADRTCTVSAAACMASCLPFFCDEQNQQCTCPPNSDGIYRVDPNAPLLEVGKTPTGVDTPAACRYRSLTAGLAAAGSSGTVKAVGASTGATVLFGKSATGEAFPLDVKAGVELTSDALTSGGTYEIDFDDTTATSPVNLHSGASLSNVHIKNVAGSGHPAVALHCDDTTQAKIDSAVVIAKSDDGHRLDYGVHVDGNCGLTATSLDISGALLAGVAVEAAARSVPVALTGGTLTANGRGVTLHQGSLLLDGIIVQGSDNEGVYASYSDGDNELEVRHSTIVSNKDTGLVMWNNARAIVFDNTVRNNAAKTVWGGANSVSLAGRRSGGVVLVGNPPADPAAFVFKSNRIYSNSGDQMVVFGTDLSWRLGGASCSDANVLTCYDATTPAETPPDSYRGLFAIDASADATLNSWKSIPTAASDYKHYGTGALNVTGTGSQYCPRADPTTWCP